MCMFSSDPAVSAAIQRLRVQTVRAARMTKEEKSKLQHGTAKVNKKFGLEALRIVGEMSDTTIPCVSTGHADLDDIITGLQMVGDGKVMTVPGTGIGLPRGRISEWFGPESCGKTTLMLELVAAFQELGLRCAYVDVEHALDFVYAAKCGVDMEDLRFAQPNSAEEALNLTRMLTDLDIYDLIVVDSVAALVPEDELSGDIGDAQMGKQARLMSQALRIITNTLGLGKKTHVAFVNQTRSKIGVMYGNPETTTGGNALKFYASNRFRVTRVANIKKGSKDYGIRSKVRCIKNKVGAPFRECFIDICGGEGITATHKTFSRDKGGGGD